MRERSQNFDPRQVMHRDTFEIFHYRDPRPGFVEVHHHDFYEVYFLSGSAIISMLQTNSNYICT